MWCSGSGVTSILKSSVAGRAPKRRIRSVTVPTRFRSDNDEMERLAEAFIARCGMRALRQLLPTAGVPLEILERDDWARLIARASQKGEGERSA